jgi:SAM-dependent methyltransferase
VLPRDEPVNGRSEGSAEGFLRRAHEEVHGEEAYAGQQGFTTAAEILALASAAGASRGRRVLDLCCGPGGPALLVAEKTGCLITGLDLAEEAVSVAREAARERGLEATSDFVVGDALFAPLASSSFDAVLFCETALAFERKRVLLREVRRLLRPGGRLAMTLEEGEPLVPEERRSIPDGDTVWPVPEGEFLKLADEAGLKVIKAEERTASHARVAARLCAALRRALADEPGARNAAVGREISRHERWATWLTERRVRKLVVVAERPPDAP